MEMDAAAPSEFLTAFSKERRSYTKAGLQKDNLCVVAKKASASHILFNWVETRNNSTIAIVKTIYCFNVSRPNKLEHKTICSAFFFYVHTKYKTRQNFHESH